MKKRLSQFIIIVLCLVSTLVISKINTQAATSVNNGVNYETYTVSNLGLVKTQDAYVVKNVIYSFNIEGTSEQYNLINPKELYFEKTSGYTYIVEAGDKTNSPLILKVDPSFDNTDIIKYEGFVEPQGVYVTSNNTADISDDLIYVADYGAGKVFVFDINGNLVNEFGKPNHPLYGESMLFKPSKIVVDHVGTMYIQDAGNPNGLVQLTSDGEFLGYFGANYTTPDMAYIIKFMFSTKEQKKKLYRQPISPVNMAIDNEGLINTVTKNSGTTSLKRLNIAGINLLNPQYPYQSNSLVDIAIGSINNIYTVDAEGYIYEYDVNGDLLFLFGGPDNSGENIGLFRSPQGIVVDTNYNLYVVDNGRITIFAPTKFCDYVHEAIYLYQNGLYQRSRTPWENVLQLNNMFDLAHRGIGKAYLIEQNYEKALYHFKLSGDTAGYSQAYWELRNEWLSNNLSYILIIILVLVTVYYVLKLLEKKNKLKSLSYIKEFFVSIKTKLSKVKLLRELGFIFNMIKHPLDSFYEIKKHNKASFLSATILYIIFFIELVLSNVFTGFIFNPVDVETISVMSIFTSSILVILLFVICHYLIASIVQGNGSLKNVYISTIYSFAPVIIFLPFLIIISNYLTLNEAFIHSFGNIFIYGWSFILLFFMIKETQELEVGETIANICLTVITMVLFVAFGFLFYALFDQIFTFIKDVILEVISIG